MRVDVTVPPVGESITEGVLAEWLKGEGDLCQVDEPLYTLETDKVTMNINAVAAGRLHITVAAGATVTIGQTVGAIDTAATSAAAPAPARPAAPPAATAPAPAAAPPPAPPQPPGPPITPPAGLPQARAKAQGERALSPAVRRVVEELKLDPHAVPATGKGGRLTKEDVLRAAAGGGAGVPTGPGAAPDAPTAQGGAAGPATAATEAEAAPASTHVGAGAAPAPAASAAPALALPRPSGDGAGAAAPAPAGAPGARQTRTPLTPLRARIAERLLAAKNQTAMLTTFNEVDMTNVMALRAQYRDAFKQKHGIDLGFMSFFLKAAVDALRTVPEVNSQIQGDELVRNHYYDLGVAVSTERGLVVPVVRDVDRLSYAGVEHAIAELARKVRERTISLAELSGGVFTVTNGGIYGNLLSTPILNPPQSAILGMHAIKKRPIAVGDAVVVRPMMYLAVSYDHRVIDGREAVTFLKRIVAVIENPDRMMLEI
ncbi:MAG TPA: 2-oxoglutarate dehydrogenase complex dihydrolipoyllysine-residue succinyltransferase [Polyangia bacterium]|jgi:2-oxoglutarate dehydrogenase E2 component (dihydrolipoamide succinyltransferase)